MEGIIEAILNMEQKAETALAAVQREKDKLPARIEAETNHVRQVFAKKTDEAILKLKEESEAKVDVRIQEIEEASAKQLEAIETDFNDRREELRLHLFERLTTWTT